MRDQLTRAILEWMREGGLSQRRAAEELGINHPNFCQLLSGENRVAVGTLLDAWERVGGQWELKLGSGSYES